MIGYNIATIGAIPACLDDEHLPYLRVLKVSTKTSKSSSPQAKSIEIKDHWSNETEERSCVDFWTSWIW